MRLNIAYALAAWKRSAKRMANWLLAMAHSLGGIFHSFSDLFKTRKSSFSAASSFGKWPLAAYPALLGRQVFCGLRQSIPSRRYPI